MLLDPGGVRVVKVDVRRRGRARDSKVDQLDHLSPRAQLRGALPAQRPKDPRS